VLKALIIQKQSVTTDKYVWDQRQQAKETYNENFVGWKLRINVLNLA
jgi:hypothetical protein